MTSITSPVLSATKQSFPKNFNGARIFVGDAGGTHFRVGYGKVRDGKFELLLERDYRSNGLTGAESGVHRFLAETGVHVDLACLGVAGPVQDGVADLTNLSWTVDARSIAALLGLHPTKCQLVNDMVAITRGALVLPDSEIVILNTGVEDPTGTVAILAAGTGLGEAGAYFVPELRRYRALASEGGHAQWAPPNSELDSLLPILRQRLARVSWEEVLSGRGLYNLYSAMLSQGSPELGLNFVPDADPNAAITNAALEKSNQVCMRAVRGLIENYAAAACNLALTLKSTGGVLITGNIATTLLPLMTHGQKFMDCFLDRSSTGVSSLPPNHAVMLGRMPVKVVTNTKVGMLGAAAVAIEGE